MVFCPIQGHQMNEITSICTLEECQQTQRLACGDCVKEERHSHGYQCFSYLISLNKFNTDLQDSSLIDKMKVQRKVQEIENIMREVKQIYCSFQNILAYLDIYQQYIQSNYQIQQLNICQINNLVKFNVAQRDYLTLNYHIESLVIQIQNLQFDKIQYQMPPKLNSISETSESYPIPIISENEKYLGIFGKVNEFRNLKIISLLRTNTLYSRKIILQTPYQSFSRDSRFMILFCFNEKQIFFFQVKNLKLILKFKVGRITFQNINDIIWINNTTLMYDSGEDLRICDMAQRQTQQIINEQFFDQLQYDESHDMIVGSKEKKILFFDRKNGDLIFYFQMKYPVQQFQIQDMGQTLFVNCNSELQIFQIDYDMKSLSMFEHVRIQQDFKFFAVNDFKKVIIIQDNKLEILVNFTFDIAYQLQVSMRSHFINYQSRPNIQISNYILFLDQEGEHRILQSQKPNY